MDNSMLIERITQLVIEELKNNNNVSLDNLFQKVSEENEGSSKESIIMEEEPLNKTK